VSLSSLRDFVLCCTHVCNMNECTHVPYKQLLYVWNIVHVYVVILSSSVVLAQ
jgi:hypothetical protein